MNDDSYRFRSHKRIFDFESSNCMQNNPKRRRIVDLVASFVLPFNRKRLQQQHKCSAQSYLLTNVIVCYPTNKSHRLANKKSIEHHFGMDFRVWIIIQMNLYTEILFVWNSSGLFWERFCILPQKFSTYLANATNTCECSITIDCNKFHLAWTMGIP